MNNGMKLLTLLQLGVLGGTGAFIYSKDFKNNLSQKVSNLIQESSSSPTLTQASSVIKLNIGQEVKTKINKVIDAGISYKDITHKKISKTFSAELNYELLYKKITFSNIIAKNWDVSPAEILLDDTNVTKTEITFEEVSEINTNEIATKEVATHFGFKEVEKVVVQSWAAQFTAIEIKENVASANQETFEVTVSEDVTTQNKLEEDKVANKLSAPDKNEDLSDYSPTKIEFRKSTSIKELNNQEIPVEENNIKLSHKKIEKIDLNKMLEESNKEFEKLDLENIEEEKISEIKSDEYPTETNEFSSSVNMAIQREMDKRIVNETVKPKSITHPLLAQTVSSQGVSDVIEKEAGSKRSISKSSDELVGSVKAFGIDLSSGKSRDIRGFDLSYSYEYNNNQNDENTGAIDFNVKTSSSMNVMRVNIRGDNQYMASNSDLALEDDVTFSIPLLNREGLFKFLEKKNLNGIGSFVLVELSSATTSVEISSSYEGKVFFDENFKETEAVNESQYALFVGVKPGNALLSFQTVDNEVVDKVINTTEDELYFDTNDYYPAKRETIQLFEKKLMSNEKVPLEFFKERINYFNTNINFEKKSLNTYSYLRPRMSLGMRKYFEVHREQGLLVVGYSDNNKIEIPSENLIKEYTNIMGIEDGGQVCTIQLNLPSKKEIKNVLYNGYTTHGDSSNMSIDMLAIDSDGQHGREIADKTKTIILSSGQQGTISTRIDYQDGTTELFNTFCSPDTYLIEQF